MIGDFVFCEFWGYYYVNFYQSNSQEHELEHTANLRATGDVTVAHSWHGHHQEIDCVPVSDGDWVGKVRKVSRIFKLKEVAK